MIFNNENGHELKFDLAGLHYRVAAGADVDVPDRYAYCIKGRGIALTDGPGKGKKKSAPVKGEKMQRFVPPIVKDEPTEAERAEELAAITGEEDLADPSAMDDEPGDGDPAARAAAQLEAAGVTLPGRKPGKAKG